MTTELKTCRSWLHGKYFHKSKYINEPIEIEINTKIPYVGIGDYYFVQGEEADWVIDEINIVYNKDGRTTPKTAALKWANIMGIELPF